MTANRLPARIDSGAANPTPSGPFGARRAQQVLRDPFEPRGEIPRPSVRLTVLASIRGGPCQILRHASIRLSGDAAPRRADVTSQFGYNGRMSFLVSFRCNLFCRNHLGQSIPAESLAIRESSNLVFDALVAID